MYCKLAFATLAVIFVNDFTTAEQIPSTTTAAEMWNPWTWFWPYAIASAEGYRDYYQKAQKATNELYQQIYKTNAFPWITGNWGPSQPQPQPQPKPQPDQNGGQSNQNGQNTGEQSKPTQDDETNTEKPAKEEENTEKPAKEEEDTKPTEEKNEESQPQAEGTGAQVEGNVQDDGTADAQVKPN